MNDNTIPPAVGRFNSCGAHKIPIKRDSKALCHPGPYGADLLKEDTWGELDYKNANEESVTLSECRLI